MKIPANRVIAFLGPTIAAISTAVAAYLVAKVNVLGIPGLDQANVQTYVAGGLTAALVAGLHALGGLSWFKGQHIILEGEAREKEAQASPGLVSGVGRLLTSGVDDDDPDDEEGDDVDPMLADLPVTDPSTLPEDYFGSGETDESRVLVQPPQAEPLMASSNRSVSGLSAKHRERVRAVGMQAISLCVRHSSELQYTQGPSRWQGIASKLFASIGLFPKFSDCSSWATWVLYQGLRLYKVRDLINGQRWLAGYTGTMLQHGKVVHHEHNLKRLDLVIYNGHVAVYIGGGKVASHGSRGVHILPVHYRKDVVSFRRYI